MKATQEKYPLFNRKMFLKRILVSLALIGLVNTKKGNSALLTVAKMKG